MLATDPEFNGADWTTDPNDFGVSVPSPDYILRMCLQIRAERRAQREAEAGPNTAPPRHPRYYAIRRVRHSVGYVMGIQQIEPP